MKKCILVFTFFFFSKYISAQEFIKMIDDTSYGFAVRILPTNDNGWVIFSLDSLRLTKFDKCGVNEWSKKYELPNFYHGVYDFIKTSNDGFAILTRNEVNQNIHSSLVTRINPQGDILWSKSYEDSFFTQVPYTINTDIQGNFYIYSNTQPTGGGTGYNHITKINPSGNIIWSKDYDRGGTWGGAIYTSDNGLLYRTGSIYVKLDSNGNVQWATFAGSVDYYFAPIEVSDGYITNFANYPGSSIYFQKLDLNGNVLGGGSKVMNYDGIPPHMRKHPNGNIAGVFNKYISGKRYPVIIEFDKDLNVVASGSLNLQDAFVVDVNYLTDGTPLITGIIDNSKVFYAKLDKNYKSSCDTAVSEIIFNTANLFQQIENINYWNFGLKTVSKTFPYTDIPVSEITLCTSPKSLKLPDDTMLCNNFTLDLQNIFNYSFDHYQWNTGQSTSEITINKPGKYWLNTFDDCVNGIYTDTIVIDTIETVIADLGNDVTECENKILTLKSATCDSCIYSWSTGERNDSVQISSTGNYWLEINNKGCTSSDTVSLDFVKCECDLYVPNSFTPNNDGKNETFGPVFYCDMESYDLTVYDRWGKMIFNSDNNEISWNGKLNGRNVPEGIYIYLLNYTPVLKGKSTEKISKTGTVAVIN
jgi:gliding motility-associated-like protein